MIPRLILSSILLVAGVLHLSRPELFEPAIPFSHKWEINLVSGILEILLGICIWNPKTRDLSAKAAALWFMALIPIHVYVSVYEIPMFGISSPTLLWARTFFQPVLFFLALSAQGKGWIMRQRWNDVLFLHFAVDPVKLQQKTPFELDLYQGKAIISIVPFVMSHIRFPFLLSVPGLSQLLELNLRTYVKVEGRPGVYFFTLDSNHLPGVLIAKWFFALPYRWIKLSFSHNKAYEFSSPEFEVKAHVLPEVLDTDFDRWATERYALFTKRGTTTLCGIVEHAPWKHHAVKVASLDDRFSSLLGSELKAGPLLSASYAKVLDVQFRPFK